MIGYMNTRTSYHHGDLRAALLTAGESALAENGLRGFTLRDCARRAGVSHAAPRHHFGSVGGFLTAIAARGYDRLTERLAHELEQAHGLAQEFLATTIAYVGFAEDYPEHFRIMFRADLVDMQAADLVEAATGTFTVLTNVIRRQKGKPEATRDEVREGIAVQEVGPDILIGWSHIHGFAHLMLEGRLGQPDADTKRLMMKDSARRLSGLLTQADQQNDTRTP